MTNDEFWFIRHSSFGISSFASCPFVFVVKLLCDFAPLREALFFRLIDKLVSGWKA